MIKPRPMFFTSSCCLLLGPYFSPMEIANNSPLEKLPLLPALYSQNWTALPALPRLWTPARPSAHPWRLLRVAPSS